MSDRSSQEAVLVFIAYSLAESSQMARPSQQAQKSLRRKTLRKPIYSQTGTIHLVRLYEDIAYAANESELYEDLKH
jgi:hypothetical protein